MISAASSSSLIAVCARVSLSFEDVCLRRLLVGVAFSAAALLARNALEIDIAHLGTPIGLFNVVRAVYFGSCSTSPDDGVGAVLQTISKLLQNSWDHKNLNNRIKNLPSYLCATRIRLARSLVDLNQKVSALNPINMLDDQKGVAANETRRAIDNLIQAHSRTNLEIGTWPDSLIFCQ